MIDRKEIENIKELLKQKLNNNSGEFLQSIIRDLDRRKADIKDVLNDDKNINDIIKNLGIPATQKSIIKAELEKAQSKIAKVYDDYFSELPGKITDADYEKMLAVHEVDFSQINKAERKIIEQEIKRAARAGYGYETLRSRLKDRNICDANAKTLANTALAQFDNAYMFENAKQAGIEYYKYDGPLNTNTRTFCKGHLGNVYTIDEIKLMDNGQGLSVLTSLGGYNCSHYWSPIINPDTTKNKKVDESKTASNGMFSNFYEKGKDFALRYETTVKDVKVGEKASEGTKAINFTNDEISNKLYEIRKNSANLEYSKKDFASDFNKHGIKDFECNDIYEFREKAREIVSNATHYLLFEYVDNLKKTQTQFAFFTTEGCTVVNMKNEIKCCYKNKDMIKTFNNIKKERICLLNKGATWRK